MSGTRSTNPDSRLKQGTQSDPKAGAPVDSDQEREHPLWRCARLLDEWAYCDSMIRLDRPKLRRLLNADSETSGYLLDDRQCSDFICGDDTGRPPAKLVADFPRTHAYLEELWA